jgi:hypothetical protein
MKFVEKIPYLKEFISQGADAPGTVAEKKEEKI